MQDINLVQVFFIITGIAVVILTILVGIALFYIITFVRTIRTVARTAQRATEIVSEDFADLRESIREKGPSIGAFAKFANNLRKKKVYNKRK